jgi:hypothetical protein
VAGVQASAAADDNDEKEPAMPRRWKEEGPAKEALNQDVKKDQAPDEDVEGHSFIVDTETNRALAREREKDIQRNLRSESRRPFFRRGR